MHKTIAIALCLLYLLAPLGMVDAASGDALTIVPSTPSVNLGDTFTISVFAASPNQAMNAVSGSITFPANISLVTISKVGSIINFWTEEPHRVSNSIRFEGITLNPGYRGSGGKLFTATFTTKKSGSVPIIFSEGSLLANDGRGTNILSTLGRTTVSIKNWETAPLAEGDTIPTTIAVSPQTKPVVLPVITDYSPSIMSKTVAYLRGKGEPNALTKIVFRNTAMKSVGERFLDFVQTKKTTLDEVLVKNDTTGSFEYTSNNNLVAGVYNATPFLVDENTNTERPGLGVQLLVNDSKIVHVLVVLINILGLLIPIVGLAVLIYFIPWYSARRMHLLKRQIGLEEEKIELTEHRLKSQDKILEKDTEKTIAST